MVDARHICEVSLVWDEDSNDRQPAAVAHVRFHGCWYREMLAHCLATQ